MKISKKLVLSVLGTAVLGFLVEKLLSPVLEWLYSLFLQVGTIFFDTFSDSVYRSISNGYSEQAATSSLILILLIFVVGIIAVLAFVEELYQSRLQKYDEIISSSHEDVDMKNNESQTISEEKPYSLEELQLMLDKIANRNAQVKAELEEQRKKIIQLSTVAKKNLTKDVFILKSMLLLFLAFILFTYGKQSFINSCVTCTMNNIEIVSPYITDTEYKQLKSDFHSIKNHADYDALTDILNKIASENDLELKE